MTPWGKLGAYLYMGRLSTPPRHRDRLIDLLVGAASIQSQLRGPTMEEVQQ